MSTAATLTPCLAGKRRRRIRGLVLVVGGIVAVVLSGCATWRAPETTDDTAFRARAVTASQEGVRVSAAVLSAEDSHELFGADVNGTGVQPVWLEVQNRSPDTLLLLHAGTDPNYFSPLEVAWSFHAPLAGAHNAAIDEHFDALAFDNPIPPQSTRAGVLFTNPHHQTRVLNVDLLGLRRMLPFTLFLPVPDNPPDEVAEEVVERYATAAQEDLHDSDTFRTALERLPCCATDARGMLGGDPINVVLIGKLDDIAAAVVRRGYRSDRWQIDDNQRLFSRRPDIVLRLAGEDDVSPHWMRAWVAPLRYRGQPIFLVQAGRPIGGRSALSDRRHLKLHPDVDEARNLLVQDLLYSGGLAKLGYVEGAGPPGGRQPRDGLGGGQYHTDGFRAVMFFETRPRTLSDVELLDWSPYLAHREREAAVKQTDVQP